MASTEENNSGEGTLGMGTIEEWAEEKEWQSFQEGVKVETRMAVNKEMARLTYDAGMHSADVAIAQNS